jgi:hypothetical protein
LLSIKREPALISAALIFAYCHNWIAALVCLVFLAVLLFFRKETRELVRRV